MAIRAVVFDIGGILEIGPDGGEPTRAFADLLATWEGRLCLSPGEMRERLNECHERLSRLGHDGELGTCTEAQWQQELCRVTHMDQDQLAAFMADHWNAYLGVLNVELAEYFRGLRPRYQTALLSNSFIGAREQEQARHGFEDLCDLIVYSHEEGMKKPDPRIYALTCERLGVRPGEMVFLDDAEPNVAAARDLGIHAILYRDNPQAIAEIEACLHASTA
jgi:putative hydrolase of the HAD superfamily